MNAPGGSKSHTKTKWNLSAPTFVPGAQKRVEHVAPYAQNNTTACAIDDIQHSLPDDILDALASDFQLDLDNDPVQGEEEDAYWDEELPYVDGSDQGVYDQNAALPGDDNVLFLQQEFPQYSIESLIEILRANDEDVIQSINVLTQLEIANGEEAPARLESQVAPALNELNFPSLGDSSSSSSGHDKNAGKIDYVKAVQTQSQVRHTAPQNAHPKSSPSFVPSRDMPSAPQRHEFKGGVSWVSSGEAVSKQYREYRKDAIQHMKARNQYFEQATKAYLAGNKNLAKQLSEKGHVESERMKYEHAQAAKSIFSARNAGLNPENKIQTLDLHGLHVKEGLSYLR